MIPYLLLNDVNSTANAMIDGSFAAHSYFNTVGENMTNTHFSSQVQQFSHQVTQQSEFSDWNQSYDIFTLPTTDGLPMSSFKPFPSSNFSSFDTQALLGDCDEFALSAIDNLPLSSLMPLELSSCSKISSQDLENYITPTKSTEHNVLTAFDNFTYRYMPKSQTVLNYKTYQPDLKKFLTPSPSLITHSLKDELILNNESVIPDTEKSRKRKIRIASENPNFGTEGNNKTKRTKQHVCHVPNCGKIYSQIWHFKKHLDWHNGKNNFFCAHCNRGFTRKDALRFHIIIVHMSGGGKRATKCQCPNCSADKTGGPDGKLQHVCHFVGCKKVFNKRVYLKEHFKRHSVKRPYLCTWNECGKSFVRRSELTKHMKLHKKLSKCPCINCSADDSRKVKDTKGRLQHICHVTGCGRVYSRFENFLTHLKRHNGENSYRCTWTACGKSFVSKFALSVHTKAHKNLKVTNDQSTQQCVKENSKTEEFNGIPSKMPTIKSSSTINIQNSLQVSMHPTSSGKEDHMDAQSYSDSMILTPIDNANDSSTCQTQHTIQESLTSMFIDELVTFVMQTHTQRPFEFSN